MKRASIDDMLKGKESRYAVVIAVAKRAREIASKAADENRILLEKPVSMAVADLTEGDYKIMMPDSE